MLNKEKHRVIMGKILRDIYSDVTISSLLGFKGGTCAYFFHNLPRFSVDLDFDLLEQSEATQNTVFEKIVILAGKYGTVKDRHIKRFTLFVLLSYGEDDHNIKIEINTRELAENIRDHYEMREYLGISMLVGKQDYLFASKLAALTSRNETAMRDIYDIRYFAEHSWDINAEIIKLRTGKTVKEYLAECAAFIENIDNHRILQGLGELIENEKEKDRIRNHLKTDAIFLLKNYLLALE